MYVECCSARLISSDGPDPRHTAAPLIDQRLQRVRILLQGLEHKINLTRKNLRCDARETAPRRAHIDHAIRVQIAAPRIFQNARVRSAPTIKIGPSPELQTTLRQYDICKPPQHQRTVLVPELFCLKQRAIP